MSGQSLTPSSFLEFYPQFACFSGGRILPEYIRQANARFSDFGEDADEARRLLTAHRLTLYAMACPAAENPTMAQLAAAGRGSRQEIASKKVGEVSVSYAESSASAAASTNLRDLPETVFGLQLLSLLKLYGFSRYIP